MNRLHLQYVVTAAIASIAFVAASSTQPLRAAAPETAMVTLHAKAGAETELARVLERHWATARRLNLVLPETHVTLRGTEDRDKTYFVEVFTWRDGDIPDSAPPEIQAIWADMNRLVEPRGGRPGLSFTEVSIVPASREL